MTLSLTIRVYEIEIKFKMGTMRVQLKDLWQQHEEATAALTELLEDREKRTTLNSRTRQLVQKFQK